MWGLFHTLARDDPGLSEAFLENVRYCRENGLFFSVAPEDYTAPFAKQALEMAPDNFFFPGTLGKRRKDD